MISKLSKKNLKFKTQDDAMCFGPKVRNYNNVIDLTL
jgi:hypothetical protein